MRSVKLRYDSRARSDIDALYRYTAERDPAAAARVVARIRALSEQLIDRPHLGHTTNVSGVFLRSVAKYPYVIFYTIRPSEIVILHVRHTARREPDPSEVT